MSLVREVGRRSRGGLAIAVAVCLIAFACVTTATAAPNGPDDVGLYPGPGQVRITWAPQPVTDYLTGIKVDAQPGPASCSARADAGTCTITGLTNGQAYTFAFHYVGQNGFTWPGDVTGPVWPCCSVPGPPVDVRAEAQQGAAAVSWQPPANEGATGGNLRYAVVSAPEGGRCETSERSCRIEGLQDGTGYTFEIRATNSQGTGEPATSQLVTPMGPPGAPTDVRVVLRDKGRATVSWLGPTKTGGAIVDRYVAVASPGGATCSSTGVLGCDLGGLRNGVEYRFSVTAYNAHGAGPLSTPSGVAKPLTGPGTVRSPSVALAGTRATIRWGAPRSDGGTPIREYVVRSSPAGATCTSRTLTCSVGGLRAGTRYVFVVQARNARGLGLTTQTRAVTTPGGAAPAPTTDRPDPAKPEVPLS